MLVSWCEEQGSWQGSALSFCNIGARYGIQVVGLGRKSHYHLSHRLTSLAAVWRQSWM